MSSHHHKTQPGFFMLVYTNQHIKLEELLPHLCSWGWDVPVPPYLWGGCAGRDRMRSGRQSPAGHFPHRRQRQLCLSTDGMQRHCLLSDKGNYVAKDGFKPGLTFFLVLLSVVLITYIPSLIHHPLAPSRLAVSAWAWQPRVFIFYRVPQEPAQRERSLSTGLFNDWGVCSVVYESPDVIIPN